MRIEAYIPKGPLAGFIAGIHYLSGSGIGTGVALQRLHQVIILNLGTGFSATDIYTGIPRQEASAGSVWVNGKQEKPFMLENGGTTSMYAVTLQPGMLPYFAGLPAWETNELAVGAEHWKASGLFDLQDQLMLEDPVLKGFRMIEAWLTNHLKGTRFPDLDRVRWLGRALYTMSVADICRTLGVTRKRLREEALHRFGGPVKELQGIIRFNRALAAIAGNADDRLNSLHDFYDQSHFIHDFKARALMTPLQYRRLCARYPFIQNTPNFMAMPRETFLQFLAGPSV